MYLETSAVCSLKQTVAPSRSWLPTALQPASSCDLCAFQVETWRPRVQGTQLKALAGARLPETEAEFENISGVVQSLQDCLKSESSPELFMQVSVVSGKHQQLSGNPWCAVGVVFAMVTVTITALWPLQGNRAVCCN